MSDERNSGISYTIARQIAKTFGRDGKRIGSYRHIAQGGYNHGRKDLCTAHHGALQRHRQTHAKGALQDARGRQDGALLTLKNMQIGAATAQIIRHGKGRDHFGNGRTQSSAGHAEISTGHVDLQTKESQFARRENQQPVEQDVPYAHQNVEQSGHRDVAGGSQGVAGQEIELNKGNAEAKNKKIGRGIGMNRRVAA